PGPDLVVVIRRLRASGSQVGLLGWLDVARLVDRPAREQDLVAVPVPHLSEPGVCDREDRFLKLRGGPARAPVEAEVDARDAPATRPGEALDLVPARPAE